MDNGSQLKLGETEILENFLILDIILIYFINTIMKVIFPAHFPLFSHWRKPSGRDFRVGAEEFFLLAICL
jgi:hypothetical protein